VSTIQRPISPATSAEWRRRREAARSELPPAQDGEKARNGLRIPAYTARVPAQEMAPAGFAESQQAGLTAMFEIAEAGSQPEPSSTAGPPTPVLGSPPARAMAGSPGTPAGSMPVAAAPTIVVDRLAVPVRPDGMPSVRVPTDLERSRERSAGRQATDNVASLRTLPLIVILIVQAALSLRLVTSNTAYNDEALYLWAGRLEWSHWLHNTPVPAFASYFSGAPVLYPPLGALANSIGGLAGARILSLCFMLAATVLLHGVTRRVFDRQSAAFAAALFAGLGSAQFLSAFATYDAMALVLLATAAWLGIRAASCHTTVGWLALILLAVVALVTADAAKYAATLFDPVVLIAIASFHWRDRGRHGGITAGLLAVGGTATGIAMALAAGGKPYATGILSTTLSRQPGNWPIFGILFVSAGWVGAIAILAVIGAIAASCTHQSAAHRVLAWTLAAAAFLAPAEQARIHIFTSLFKHVAFGGWFAAAVAGYALTAFIRAVPAVKSRGALKVVTIAVAVATISGSMLAVNHYGTWQSVDPVLPTLAATLQAHPGSLLTDETPPFYYYLEDFEPWQHLTSIPNSSAWAISRDIKQRRFTYVLLSFAVGGGGCGNKDPAVKETRSQCIHYIDIRVLYSIISDGGYRLIARIPYRTTSFKSDYMLWVRQGAPR
jgi:hypothetical protein